jgi:hypothetical protein
MSKLVKRCNICGRVLTKEEAMTSETCLACIRTVGTARQSQVVLPKTGSNVNPAPTPVVKMEFEMNKYKAQDKEGRIWKSPNGVDWTEKATDTQRKIIDVLDGMKNLLLYKNQKYGDSALKPKNIFYKGDATNSILVRLDDKIGRVIFNTEEKPRVNDVADIIGYCTLLLISMGVTAEDLKKFMD